jgi:hypothetical protein
VGRGPSEARRISARTYTIDADPVKPFFLTNDSGGNKAMRKYNLLDSLKTLNSLELRLSPSSLAVVAAKELPAPYVLTLPTDDDDDDDGDGDSGNDPLPDPEPDPGPDPGDNPPIVYPILPPSGPSGPGS